MNRRNFVLLAGVGITSLAVPVWYYGYRDLEYDPLLTEPELLSYIWDGNTIDEIGNSYLKQFPDENTERALVKLLSKGLPADHATIPSVLQQTITNDYNAGNTVMVEGWLLSRTEARQCALFSLTQNK